LRVPEEESKYWPGQSICPCRPKEETKKHRQMKNLVDILQN